MNKNEIRVMEKHFPNENDQSKAIWYIRSAKAAAAKMGRLPTKDRIWDQYCHSAVIWGVREVLEKHRMERYIPMLRELGLIAGPDHDLHHM